MVIRTVSIIFIFRETPEELQLSRVNLEGRVQSCRGLEGKLMKDKPNNYTLTLNVLNIDNILIIY